MSSSGAGCTLRSRPQTAGSGRSQLAGSGLCAKSVARRLLRSWRSAVSTAVVAASLTVIGTAPVLAEARTLDLRFSHTSESIQIVYKRDGRYVQPALRDLNRFLRDWRRNEATTMAPELFDLLWEVQQDFGGAQINIVSAYRSPATNAMLRSRSRGVAKHSQHMLGHAIDFYIKGADLYKLRVAGLKRQVGGVGYYPNSNSPFVHMDVGSVRAWPRLSSTELARIFPDGKTLHIPSNGKPMSGYAEAQALEKQGKLASLGRGSSGGGASGGLLALVGLGRGRGGADDDARVVRTARVERTRVTSVVADAEESGDEASARGGPSMNDEMDREPVIVASRGRARTTTEQARASAAAAPAGAPAPARSGLPGVDAPVETASLVRSSEVAPQGGLFRQLPSVSLGGLIGRSRGDDAPEPPEVLAVPLPSAPLTAVTTDSPFSETGSAPLPENRAATATASAPVPRLAPRPATADPSASDAGTEGADPVGDILDAARENVVVAALPPLRPRGRTATDLGIPAEATVPDTTLEDATVADATGAEATVPYGNRILGPLDAVTTLATAASTLPASPTATLAFARDDVRATLGTTALPGLPARPRAATVPRSALLPPPRAPRTDVTEQSLAPPPPGIAQATLDAMMSPVLGASAELISDTSGVASDRFADLQRPDRDGAAEGGVLLAQNFLGTPTGLQSGTDAWPSPDRFTGTRITVFAQPQR